jgi:hypothetical protein
MNRAIRAIVAIALMEMTWLCPLRAQQYEPENVNSNLGVSMSVPQNPTSQFATIGYGFTAGVGYNFTRRHSLIGEFMWNRLNATDAAIAPLRAAAPASDLDGHGDLFAVTANYRFEIRGRVFGAYFIGGGGWYYRNTGLSRQVTAGAGTVCTQPWLWWGFTCVSGTVLANQTLAENSSNAFGGNGGIGFTVKLREPSYRFYVESRYHYAPTSNINTQLVNVTVGIRY